MKLVLRLALASLWFTFVAPISAQTPGVSLPFVNNAQPGLILNLPVSVTGFDSITSMDMVVRWNPAVLQYLIIDQYNLNDFNASNVNTTNALDSGFVRVSWETPTTSTGTTVANGTNIFRLRLKVIGAIGTSTALDFTQQGPTFLEFSQKVGNSTKIYNLNPANMQPLLDHGFVAVGYTVDASEAGLSALQARVSPNPFSEQTRLDFQLATSASAVLSAYDMQGREVFSRPFQATSGANTVNISSDEFPQAGAYIITLRCGHEVAVLPITLF